MLTAVEAFLVSLYRPPDAPPAEKQLVHEKCPSPSSPRQTDASRLDSEVVLEVSVDLGNVLKDAPKHGDTAVRTDAPLDPPTPNSSSSSIAEDWIVNQIPAGLESSFSLYDDQTAEKGSANKSPERPEDETVSGAETTKDQLSAEDWSRGTALTDPVSGEPLQPVRIHQPSKNNHPDSDEVKSPSSSNKKMLNAITEKRAALTAYDLISNRAMRAPLSPAALFEKEARAEVLREKPAASLQDISDAVHERWKNLREEDRKK